ncbi:hypothetical protein BHK98_10685 [Hornefia porci]|uniref:Methyltransferase small domain-containing protein n=1 Tax=Hornefia porci TaxID=2652292 RepID=A0A1Q9JJV4_9FIRM|nr:hypothetical protein [Hornefia porci]OLR56492.1 hypothetical protein BHK98_10685 [Hornefia porci]
MTETEMKEKRPLRIDDTGFGSVRILQDPETFCYGVDAVLLAGFAAARLKGRSRPSRLCDLGTGNGIVPLILSHKTHIGDMWGVEVQEEVWRLAVKNVELNDLEDRLHFLHANVRDIRTRPVECQSPAGQPVFPAELGGPGSFDAVTMNPPYTAAGSGLPAGNEARTIARHEVAGSLEDFLRAASALLKDKGHLFIVHRPSRLIDLCELCRRLRLEPGEIVFVSGKPMEKPNIVLMHCVRNGNRGLRILPEMHVREPDGSFSHEMLKLYERETPVRDAASAMRKDREGPPLRSENDIPAAGGKPGAEAECKDSVK